MTKQGKSMFIKELVKTLSALRIFRNVACIKMKMKLPRKKYMLKKHNLSKTLKLKLPKTIEHDLQ